MFSIKDGNKTIAMVGYPTQKSVERVWFGLGFDTITNRIPRRGDSFVCVSGETRFQVRWEV